MDKRKEPKPATEIKSGEEVRRSKKTIYSGSAILFHNDDLGAWVAPGRRLIRNVQEAHVLAASMRVILDGR